MRFKIINSDTEDYVVLEADTIEEIQKEARQEIKKRGWTNYHSEKI